MKNHDPIRAAVEELSGMQDCMKVLDVMTRAAERQVGEAEAHWNALLKLRGFLAGRMDEIGAKLVALRAAAEAKAENKTEAPT